MGGQGHNWGRSQLGGSSWWVHNWSVREGEVRAGGKRGSQMGGSHVEEVEEGRVCARTTGDQFLSPTAKSQRLLGCMCSFFYPSFLSLPPFILFLASFSFSPSFFLSVLSHFQHPLPSVNVTGRVSEAPRRCILRDAVS